MTEPKRHLYRGRKSIFEPTALTTGPWRPDAQHGGPPAALLAYLCEQELGEGETLARLSVKLVAGVPLRPLEGSAVRSDVSRRVGNVDAELRCDGRLVARATALVLAGGDVPAPDWAPEPTTAPSWRDVEPVTAPHWAATHQPDVFHRDGLEHRFVDGAFDRPGPARDWVRLRCQVVEGTEPTGVQQTMGSVDVGSGISAVFDPESGFGMINADLDVAFVRAPEGRWLLLDAVTSLGSDGTGVAITHVHDDGGLVAVATQCLLGTTIGS